MNVEIGNKNIDVKIVYKNNKNIYFRFDEHMNLVVTCPKKTPDFEIIHLINKNEDAILKMYEKSLDKVKYDNEFWLLGKKYNEVINNSLDDVVIDDEIIYVPNSDAKARFIEDKINEVFNREVDLCKKCFASLPQFSLKFRKMKSRWGVCDTKKKIITLNTELIKKDIDLIDYVIIHEMAHFYEGNHGKKFWEIVSAACPNCKEKRARLRK